VRLRRKRFVLDGELVIPGQPFDALQARLHPAASRIQRLSVEMPARFVAFDLLASATGHSMLHHPFRGRRLALEKLFALIGESDSFLLSEAATSPDVARGWLSRLGHGLDGIVAKRLDIPYQAGARAMLKYKVWKTVDCVVGGVYCQQATGAIEYLLMGLYDDTGLLNYVGRCGAQAIDPNELAGRLVPLLNRGGGFTGKQPGAENRWSGSKRELVPVVPELVAEVSADHVENGRFRHGSRFVRWRPDKKPNDCRIEQVA
jgi:ATP-dependent DNA ligase